jgi:hypothetical protein
MSILSYTQKQFVEEISSNVGRGRRHAARLYRAWMREGNWDDLSWVEPQAKKLV